MAIKSRTSIVLILVFVVLCSGLMIAWFYGRHQFKYGTNRADKLQVLALLKSKQFDELDNTLGRFEQAFKTDYRSEFSLFDEYDTFGTADPNLSGPLNEWVALKPSSARARLARAIHEMAKGWQARGGGWTSETTNAQFQGMEDHFGIAIQDARAALKLDPSLLNGYIVLVDIYDASGNAADAERAYEDGIRLFSGSLMLRVLHVNGLAPRWGGSHQKMGDLIAKTKTMESQNPALHVLEGFIDLDEGRNACNENKKEEAIRHFSDALKAGEFYLFLEDRAACYLEMKQYEKALADTEIALPQRPQRVRTLWLHADALASLDRVSEAVHDYDLAQKIDPLDNQVQQARRYQSSIRVNKGNQLGRSKKTDEALAELQNAILLDPTNPNAYSYHAWALGMKKDFAKANAEIEKAVLLDPQLLTTYQMADIVCNQQKRWDQAVRYWTQYLQLHPEKAEAYLARARDHYFHNEKDAAITDAKKACDLGDTEGCTHFHELSGQ